MIRFVTFTGDQALSGNDPCFAFFNTVTDRFIELVGYQVFDDAEDLTGAWHDEDGFKPDLDRLLGFVERWKPVPATPFSTPAERIASVTGAAIDIVLNGHKETP